MVGTFAPISKKIEKYIDFEKGYEMSGYELTAAGAIPSDVSFVELNNSSAAIAATIAAPAKGRYLIITQTDSGTEGHTVTITSGTYDGTNNIATFNAQYETLVLFGVGDDRFIIIENVGSVGLSS